MIRRKLVKAAVVLTVGAATAAFCQTAHTQQEDPYNAYVQQAAALGNPFPIYSTQDDEIWPITGSDPIPPVKPGH